MAEDFFTEAYLEANPEAAFYSAAPFGLGGYTAGNPFGGTTYGQTGQLGAAGGFSPAAQSYWAGQYGNIQRQYLGEMGRTMRKGESQPSFVDYLEDYPFTQRYTAMSPAMRPGGGFGRYAPRTRRMYS
jgi:hypothetical protein